MPRFLLAVVVLAASLLSQDPTDAQHVKLEIELLPATQSVAGTCTWTVRSAVNGLATFTLQLDSVLVVSSVTVNGLTAPYTRPTNQVVITLDHLYQLNETFTASVVYAGAPNSTGLSSFTFLTHGGSSTIVSSLSEPWYAYTWWPCKETLTDKFTSETWVTVPGGLYATSNGLLQGVDPLSSGRSRYRWSSNYPIATYGVAVTASNYQIRTDTYTHLGANMPVVFYAYPESYAGQQTNMNRLVPMLTTFSNLVGQFPFVNEKYGIAQFNWGGGMEHQTITSQLDFSENLSAHELGHSWFGNCITCATWHDIGLNEGFATYMEALWDEFKAGGGTSAYFSRMNTNKPSNPTTTGSVYVTNISSENAVFSTTNVYRKGAWVLHQLRHVVGDAAFFQILRDYLAAKAYQSATWQEFGAIASTSYGSDLTWLLDQCVTRTGAPAFGLRWTQRTFLGQNYVLGTVTQPAGTPWRYPIDIRVTTPSGQATSVVWNDQLRDDFVIPANGNVSAVALDPSPWILRGTTTTAAWTASLSASTATVPRTGGTVTLTLDAGATNGNRPYLIGASGTGIWPGLTLPDGKRIPLEVDTFTLAALASVNTPTFANFSGTLNGSGQATAQIVVPDLGPISAPLVAHFVFVTTTPPVFVSNPVTITVTP